MRFVCAGRLSCAPTVHGQAGFSALQVLYDIGAVSTPEPFHRLVSQVRSARLGITAACGAC